MLSIVEYIFFEFSPRVANGMGGSHVLIVIKKHEKEVELERRSRHSRVVSWHRH